MRRRVSAASPRETVEEVAPWASLEAGRSRANGALAVIGVPVRAGGPVVRRGARWVALHETKGEVRIIDLAAQKLTFEA